MANYKTIVQMYTLREHMADAKQLEDTLKKVKAIGYDGVEMGTPRYLTTDVFKKMLDDIGLIATIVSGGSKRVNDDLTTLVKEAQTLGTRHVSWPTINVENRANEEGYKAFAQEMNTYGRMLAKEGLQLCYHNHALEFASFHGKHGMDIFVEETDPAAVFFIPDVHWITAGGVYAPHWIAKLKGRMDAVHCKDYGIDHSGPDIGQVPKLFAEVGYGNIDWPAVKAACDANDVIYYVVEQDHCKVSPFESIAMSIETLHNLGVK